MGRRIYVKGVDTHAKGEQWEVEYEKNERYYIQVSLLSLKTLEDYDIGRGGEFYFEVKRKGHEIRVPQRGEINLMENQVFTARQDFSLWNEFIELDPGDQKVLELDLRLYERDVVGLDKKLIDEDLKITLGSQSKYVIVENKDKTTKAKIKISAPRTRF